MARIDTAREADGSLDAQIVLLAMHSKLINPEVVERHDLGLTPE